MDLLVASCNLKTAASVGMFTLESNHTLSGNRRKGGVAGTSLGMDWDLAASQLAFCWEQQMGL